MEYGIDIEVQAHNTTMEEQFTATCPYCCTGSYHGRSSDAAVLIVEEIMRSFFLMAVGISYGLLAAAGVFTVLAAVGLIPRFAGKTHTAKHILIYEEMVIFGTVTGCVLSVFSGYCQFGAWWQRHFPAYDGLLYCIGYVWQAVFGLFSGMFVGCLALAIAEMLDSIPILSRRISFRHGLGLAIISMAAGKICGSFLYFLTEFHRTAG